MAKFYERLTEELKIFIIDWAVKKGDEGVKEYWQEKNQVSIDGLPTKLLED
jgi:hypothetical protein